MKRLATTTILVLAFVTPIFTTPATAQSQCEPDHNGNVIDLGYSGYSLEKQSSSIVFLT